MKLEVGMYVRTINDKAVGKGVIGKIKYINEREFKGELRKYYSVWTNNEDWFEILENNVAYERIKASHNIIDLIEVGDIVVSLNGANILEYNLMTLSNIDELKDLWNIQKNIKSIVTKEQFESMEYKVC